MSKEGVHVPWEEGGLVMTSRNDSQARTEHEDASRERVRHSVLPIVGVVLAGALLGSTFVGVLWWSYDLNSSAIAQGEESHDAGATEGDEPADESHAEETHDADATGEENPDDSHAEEPPAEGDHSEEAPAEH